MAKQARVHGIRWFGWLILPYALTSAWLMAAPSGDGKASTAEAAVPAAALKHRESAIDGRIRILSKALDLDEPQQAALKRLLERQREQVSQVWSDPAVPAAYRVSATRAINNQTADEIRALLNDEQKKKYNPPRQPRPTPDASSPSVEDWMDKVQSK